MSTVADLPLEPFTLRDAQSRGWSRQRLRSAVMRGEVIHVRHGWYARVSAGVCVGEHWDATREDHLRRLAVALADHPGCAGSHSSGSLTHGFPIMVSARADVELTRIEDAPSSRRLPGVIIHHAVTSPTPTEIVNGLRTTIAPRAVADTLRTRRLPHGLAMLDGALRDGTVALADIRAELDQQRRWVGRPRALQALALVDGRRESWGESYSAGLIALADLPQPIPQVEVYDENFRFVARVDGLLDQERVVIESDGEEKYRLGVTPESAEHIVRARLEAEKVRHDKLERLGLAVARWMTREAMQDPDVVDSRIKAAARRAHGTTFSGWVRWEGEFRKLPLLPRAA